MNIAHHPDFDQQSQPTEPELNFEQELKLEDQSRNTLYESVTILTYKGVKGDAMLLELLKVNLQLPRPVPLQELPIIADYNYPKENFLEDYTRVANLLEEAARPPEPVPFKAKIDIDQVIASADLQALYKHIDELVNIRAKSPVEWSLKKAQIKEAFGKSINLNDLERIVAAEQRKQERAVSEDDPDVADIARDWAYTQRNDWAFDLRSKTWRHWNGTHWEELEPKCGTIGNQAIDALHDAGKDINTQSGMDTFLRVAANARETIFPEQRGRLVNFANGTLDTITMHMLPHDRENYLTYCLPYPYVPGQHQRITEFLDQTIPDPYGRQAYMVHLGLALMGDTSLHNVMVLLGPPRSGKTTLLALANLVTGAAQYEAFNFAGHTLFSRELEGNRSRYAWRDRRLVGVDELPVEALRDEELFKQLTAHSGVPMRGMNQNERTDNRWRPKLLLSANDRPRYSDVTGAVKERAIFVECPNHKTKDQRDLGLIDRLYEEVPAFAASCIYMAQCALERSYYPLSNAMKMLLEQVNREGNNLKSFLADHSVLDPDSRIPTDFFYQYYDSYCDDNHIAKQYRLSKSAFSRAIIAMRIGVAAERVPDADGKRVRGLVGIRLRKEQDIWETETDELRRYQSDELLINGTLTVVDGKIIIQPLSVQVVEQPVEQPQVESVTDRTDKSENEILLKPTLVEMAPPVDETSRSSIEQPLSVENLSHLSEQPLEQPVEPVQSVDGCIEPVGLGVCSVKGCGQDVPVWDVEQAEKYGCWCSEHNNRSGLLTYGEALGYPHLQHDIASAIIAGEEHWKRFVTFPGAPVKHCLQYAEQLLCSQDSETA